MEDCKNYDRPCKWYDSKYAMPCRLSLSVGGVRTCSGHVNCEYYEAKEKANGPIPIEEYWRDDRKNASAFRERYENTLAITKNSGVQCYYFIEFNEITHCQKCHNKDYGGSCPGYLECKYFKPMKYWPRSDWSKGFPGYIDIEIAYKILKNLKEDINMSNKDVFKCRSCRKTFFVEEVWEGSVSFTRDNGAADPSTGKMCVEEFAEAKGICICKECYDKMRKALKAFNLPWHEYKKGDEK